MQTNTGHQKLVMMTWAGPSVYGSLGGGGGADNRENKYLDQTLAKQQSTL